MDNSWNFYEKQGTGGFFDELITARGRPRVAARNAVRLLQSLTDEDMAARRGAAELAIRKMGISFTIYSEGKNIDRAWPFDVIPRVIPEREWREVERGLKQRVEAMNLFIDDLYHAQKIVKDIKKAAGYGPNEGVARELFKEGKALLEQNALTHPGMLTVDGDAIDLSKVNGQLMCQKDAFLCAAYGTQIGIAFTKSLGT